MRVAACIVTRGNVDMRPILDSLPAEWERVVWDNSGPIEVGVYGRYVAITLTDAEVIYVQDDDMILDPDGFDTLLAAYEPGKVTANMPARFRHDFYRDSCLVGFGALFDRDLPEQAFDRFFARHRDEDGPRFYRECDLIFTGLTDRVLVDIGHTDMPYANDPDRLWKQPEHVAERTRMLELVREVRDS